MDQVQKICLAFKITRANIALHDDLPSAVRISHSRYHEIVIGTLFRSTHLEISQDRNIQTKASIWRENKLGYLSAEIICSE